jgi:hypothetical protein
MFTAVLVFFSLSLLLIISISISTSYEGTNLLGYNESEPLTSVDQTAYISSMLRSTQHKFKIQRSNYLQKSET